MFYLRGLEVVAVLLLVMASGMCIQISFLCKTFTTHTANIWSFSSMGSLMFNKVIFPFETFGTKSTCKRSALI